MNVNKTEELVVVQTCNQWNKVALNLQVIYKSLNIAAHNFILLYLFFLNHN